MSRKVGIVLIHGMGRQKTDYGKTFKKYILRINPDSKFVLNTMWWADLLDKKELGLERRLKSGPFKQCYSWLRKFVLFYLGDVLAYQNSSLAQNLVYIKVQERLHVEVQNLVKVLGPTDPIIIIGHSLGSIIASDYLWDLERNGSAIFPKIKRFITLGSPLAMYLLAYKHPTSIYLKAGEWLNIFSKNDVLAYPIKKSFDGKGRRIPIKDLEMNVGGWLTCWNPLCHKRYLQDKKLSSYLATYFDSLS